MIDTNRRVVGVLKEFYMDSDVDAGKSDKIDDVKVVLDVKVDGLTVEVRVDKFDLLPGIEYVLYSFDDYRVLVLTSEMDKCFEEGRRRGYGYDVWQDFETGDACSYNAELVVGETVVEEFVDDEHLQVYLTNLKSFCKAINGESSRF